MALIGDIFARGKSVACARTALTIGLAMIAVIVAFQIFAGISRPHSIELM